MNNTSALLEALLPAALNLRMGVTEEQLRATRLIVPDFWTSMAHSTIRTQNGVVPFEPFVWQREWADNLTDREMILKSRDVGSSEICVRKLCHLQLKDGGNILIKADKHDNAKNLISIARQYLTSLPEGERPTLTKDNETELEIPGRGTIRAMAQGGGRSERCKYLLKTERAFWANAAEEEAAISGALVAGGLVIQESTANGFNDYHADWVDPSNGYRKTFVGRDANPTHDAAWWASKQAELGKLGQMAAQEYPLTDMEAFVTSGNCVFEIALIREQQQYCREPLSTELNGQLRVWQRPVVGRHYVAGADVAEGRDVGNNRRDYSVLAIYDQQTGVNVATLRGRIDMDEFAVQCAALCKRYNNAFLGVERNNHGHRVLLMLTQLEYPNLYYHTDPVENIRTGRTEARKTAGWPTTARTKPLLEQEMAAMLQSGGMLSYDRLFWDEMLSYVRDGNGHTGAQQGTHDDLVMAHMIALLMRQQPRAGGRRNGLVAGQFKMG